MTNTIRQTPYDIEKFGSNLKKVREERNMSRRQLADLIGLTDQRIIYDYEDGFKHPRLERVILIATSLGVSIDSMLR